ncbi:MAG: prolipoprotein diacylglyceryl transferase [Faecousia sp.]
MSWIESTPISFPGLGLVMNPPKGLTLGPLNIHFYGVIIALGLVLAVAYAMKRCRQFGFDDNFLTDGVLIVVPIAIVCARLYYCVFKWEEEFAADPISVLYIWNGGLAIYGGVIGAAVATSIYCLVKKVRIPAVLDLTSLGFLIGQSIGRWGNFFNREAFGAETESFLRMGLYKTAEGTHSSFMHYYHPTFLYESVWNAIGFVLLHFLSKRRKFDGQIALLYVAWYGLGRAFIESLRTDSLYWGSFRVSQVLAAVSCIVAVAALILLGMRKTGPEALYVNQVAAKAAEIKQNEEEEPNV